MTTKLIDDVYNFDEIEDYYYESQHEYSIPIEIIKESGFERKSYNKEHGLVFFYREKDQQWFIGETANDLPKFLDDTPYFIMAFGRYAGYDDLHICCHDQCFHYLTWQTALKLIVNFQDQHDPNKKHGND